jgi:hypothetical protein
MPEIKNPSPTPSTPSDAEEQAKNKKLDRIADDAAKQAGKTEKRYDSDHDIFDK